MLGFFGKSAVVIVVGTSHVGWDFLKLVNSFRQEVIRMVTTISSRETAATKSRSRRRIECQSDGGRSAVPQPKMARRRHIDPTTCERDYGADELDFMRALDAYKRSSGRMFPTCSEILEVVRSLGYVRLTAEQAECLGGSHGPEVGYES